MIFKRRFKQFRASLCLVFLFSAIYLMYVYLIQNYEVENDLDDLEEHRIVKSTTDRDYIDPKVHDLIDPEDELEHETRKNRRIDTKVKAKHLNVYHGNHDVIDKSNCVRFKTLKGDIPICIYSRENDEIISSYIKDYGTWEPDLLNATAEILLSNPRLQFIDLGCNIGAFTLFVAKLGRKVVAVDALKHSLDLLHESLNLGSIHENVTLILNALSDTNKDVIVNVVRRNIGGSYIKDIHSSDNQSMTDTIVQAITFDDLLEIVLPNEEVFIKMDIEGSEWKALKQARNFFQTVNVRYLLMEWMLHRTSESGSKIMRFLLRNGMLPYNVDDKNEILPRNFGAWPDNIIWIKR